MPESWSSRAPHSYCLLDRLVLLLVLGECPLHDGTQKVRVQVSWAGGASEEADENPDGDSGEAAQHVEVQVRETEEQEGLILLFCVRQSVSTAAKEQLQLLILHVQLLVTQLVKTFLILYGS